MLERRPGPPPPTGEAPAVFHGVAARPRTHLSAMTAFSVTPEDGAANCCGLYKSWTWPLPST